MASHRYPTIARSLIAAPSAGQDATSAPGYVGAQRCQSLVNLLPGRAGKVVQRGPFTGYTPTADTLSGGFWQFDNKLLLGIVQSSVGKLQVADLTSSSPNLVAAYVPPASVTAPSQQTSFGRLGANVYGAPTPGSGNYITRWDGTNVVGGVAPILNGPVGTYALVAHLSRLFAVGGSVPGTASPIYTNRLYWTDPGWDGTDVLAAWQDDVSGLVNQIVLPDAAGYPLAAVSVDRTIYIVCRRGILALRGTAPSNFAVTQVATVGCAAANSVVLIPGGGLGFLSDEGFVLFDGVRPQIVSSPVQSALMLELQYANSQFDSAAALSNQFVTLATSHKWYAYHLPTGSWAELTSAAFSGLIPTAVGSSLDYRWAASANMIARTELLARPESADSGAAGWDGGVKTVPCQMTTRLDELASPGSKSKLNRLLIDVVLQSAAAVTATAVVQDQAGSTVTTVTVQPTLTATRQRLVVDVFNEVDSLQIVWTLNGSTSQVRTFEIQDTQVEFEPAETRTG